MKEPRICCVKDCTNPTTANRRICRAHEWSMNKYQTYNPQKCHVTNCDRKSSKDYELCAYHFTPWQKYLSLLDSEIKLPLIVAHICEKHGTLNREQCITHGNRAGSTKIYLACRACSHIRTRAWEKKNPENVKRRRYKNYLKNAKRDRVLSVVRQYKDLTVQEYLDMFKIQNDKCAICGEFEIKLCKDGTPQPLHVDHCHITGKTRQLLCFRCNTGIGMLRDHVGILQKSIDYIEYWKKMHAEEDNG